MTTDQNTTETSHEWENRYYYCVGDCWYSVCENCGLQSDSFREDFGWRQKAKIEKEYPTCESWEKEFKRMLEEEK